MVDKKEEISLELIEAIVNFIKIKMKDFKESNANLLKFTLDLFNFIATDIKLLN